MVESYYNYKSYGAPYYVFGPNLKSVKMKEE